MTRRSFTEEQLREHVAAGMSGREIAKIYGCGITTVHRWSSIWGIDMRHRPHRSADLIRARLDAGDSIKRVAETVGVAWLTVRKIKREMLGTWGGIEALRDALTPEAREWIAAQVPQGATAIDLIVALVNDARLDELEADL